jgi:hypothetical protein
MRPTRVRQLGGGVGFYLTPVLVVEGDVHRASVSHVFDRDHHDFTETTFTGSLLYRSTPDGRAHFIAGGGAGLQSAQTDLDDPLFRIDRTETIRLLHGRIGAEWDISRFGNGVPTGMVGRLVPVINSGNVPGGTVRRLVADQRGHRRSGVKAGAAFTFVLPPAFVLFGRGVIQRLSAT